MDSRCEIFHVSLRKQRHLRMRKSMSSKNWSSHGRTGQRGCYSTEFNYIERHTPHREGKNQRYRWWLKVVVVLNSTTGHTHCSSHQEALYMATAGGAKGSHVTPKFSIADREWRLLRKSSVTFSEQWWCSHSWKQEVYILWLGKSPSYMYTW